MRGSFFSFEMSQSFSHGLAIYPPSNLPGSIQALPGSHKKKCPKNLTHDWIDQDPLGILLLASKLFYYFYVIYSVWKKITLLLTWCKEGVRVRACSSRRNRTRLSRRRAAVRREEGEDCGGITGKPSSITYSNIGEAWRGSVLCTTYQVPGASADVAGLAFDPFRLARSPVLDSR